MNKIRLLVASLLVLTASTQAAIRVTMDVTTFEDQNGDNLAECSLREAVRAVNTRKAFGGCPAGDAFNRNVIQLKPGTYELTLGELLPNTQVEIIGGDKQKDLRKDQIDPLTGKAPRRVRPDFVSSDPAIGNTGTTIIAAPNSRIFYAASGLSLTDLVLEANGAVVGNGGLVYSSGTLSLENVVLKGGVAHAAATGLAAASGNGGAIYLAGDGSGLTLTSVTIQDSTAQNQGGAVAMLCNADLNPYAVHTVTVSGSLFRRNSSGTGAGAIQFCGNTQGSVSASTFSANASAASSGTLAYVQGEDIGLGSLDLSYITAVEQDGHVLAFNGLNNVSLAGSLLARFDSPNATELCFNPSSTVPWKANTFRSGTRNARDDATCDEPLLSPSGGNILIPTGRNISLELVASSAYPNGEAFSLTDYYLPRSSSLYVLDRGGDLDDCAVIDQRGLLRRSGTACDIGAVERLQLTAREDEGSSVRDTDRLAVIDILANDSFGEADNSAIGPYAFADNTSANPAVINVTSPNPSVNCEWRTAGDAYAGNLVVSVKDGVLTKEDEPIVCTYQVVNSNGDASPSAAVVEVSIVNAAPLAENDVYTRPVGVTSITFNPLENDSDKGDGKYGFNPELQLDGNGEPVMDGDGNPVPKRGSDGEIIFTSTPDWAPSYPIEILSQPGIGEVYGNGSGPCPGASGDAAGICLNPPLTYVADNNLAPFADSFSYRVYDKDNGSSAAATITIKTDASDPDHGGGAGSLDLLVGVLLSLLGLRRLRGL